jgi:diacylglycerol kinase family enzyme
MNDDTVLIVNPNSNSGSTGKNWDSIYHTLCDFFGDNIEVVFTKKEGDGTALARSYLKRGFKNIIPIGGDGMINEVANGFFEEDPEIQEVDLNTETSLLPPLALNPINPKAIMAILPSGTRNVLVQSLNLPNDFEECCKILGNCNTSKKIDVIAALVTDPENPSKWVKRVFLNAAEIGIGAEIISKAKDMRKKVNNRLLSTIAGIATTIPTYKSNICEITTGMDKEDNKMDNKIITKMTMGIIANGRFLGGGVQAAIKATMNDGLLDIVIIKDSDGLAFLKEAISMKNDDTSTTEVGENIYYSQSKNVSLISKEEKDVIVTMDGEPIGTLPAFFKVFPNLLTIRI